MTAPDGEVRVGVDVGGTFTDLVAADTDGVRVAKVPSTPADQSRGVLDATGHLKLDLAAVARFVHGTTVATNTVLERDGARTVLVTTAGFRDLLEIGRQDRPSLYDLEQDRPAPPVPREAVVEAAERVAADGTVLTALDQDEVARVAEAVAELDPEAVAVSLLFSFLDDAHERAIAEALADRLPNVAVSRSSDVLPVFREYERTSTTALNAYVAPRMTRYLGRLEQRLRDGGLQGPVEVMRSGGGTFTAEVAARYAVNTLLSGPAAGAWGAAAVGAASGERRIIAVDMGGTSADVSLIEDGRPRTTADGGIGGLPFAVTTTDIHTVGSGGGSIAWRDAGGALRVGPRSAGADPGPACYGRGGHEPTVTDADVVLGRLAPGTRLGGDLELDRDAAEEAVGRLADELSLDLADCAAGIVQVVEAQMAKALRVVSVERGHDPRDFTIVPFGGAGPLHQAALARELGCPRVLVPPHAGVLSALGLLAAPVTVDEARTAMRPLDDGTAQELGAAIEELARRARERVLDQGAGTAGVSRSVDLRYRGQAYELEVPVHDLDAGRWRDDFHAAHRERYGYDQPDEDVEVVNIRARAEGPAPELPLPRIDQGRGADAAQSGTATVLVDGEPADCPVFDRSRLGAGDEVEGPAVVAGLDSTLYVAPWQTGTVDEHGAILLEARS